MKRSATRAEGRFHHNAEAGQAEVINAVRQGIVDFGLDLAGRVIVTGAAGELQATTAIAAALAGASRVIAVAPQQKGHRGIATARWDALELAGHAGVSERLDVVSRMDARAWQAVDILVSCPQIGPVSRSVVELLPPHAVVALMAEPWELRPGMVDLDSCGEMHVKVVAPNLEHPSIALLPELGRLCCHLIDEAGVEAGGATIAVLCDTPCGPYIENALVARGAKVRMFPHPLLLLDDAWDAIVIALRPSEKSPMDINGLAKVFENARGAPLMQFSGEIDRLAARYFGLRVWPARKPARGQMGLPLEALGWSPMIRRVLGGLKAAESARRDVDLQGDSIGFLVGA